MLHTFIAASSLEEAAASPGRRRCSLGLVTSVSTEPVSSQGVPVSQPAALANETASPTWLRCGWQSRECGDRCKKTFSPQGVQASEASHDNNASFAPGSLPRRLHPISPSFVEANIKALVVAVVAIAIATVVAVTVAAVASDSIGIGTGSSSKAAAAAAAVAVAVAVAVEVVVVVVVFEAEVVTVVAVEVAVVVVVEMAVAVAAES